MKTIARTIRCLLPLLALIWTSAQAGELSIPNTFTSGQPAVAAQVNANFNAVRTAVNDNDDRITTLTGAVDTAETNISTNSEDIAELQTQITTLVSTLNLLQSRVEELEQNSAEEFVGDLQEVMAVDTVNDKVVFTGVNVHINNGIGNSNSVNGKGNLIVGYDEARVMGNNKSGSHNIIIGPRHNYSSHSGIVVGSDNTISGEFSSISGGFSNTASGYYSSVSGGFSNLSSFDFSSVSGGAFNTASGEFSSVSGGENNVASVLGSSVSGGNGNAADETDEHLP